MRRPPRNEPGVVNGFEGLFLPERPLFLCRHRLLRKILDNAFKKPKGPGDMGEETAQPPDREAWGVRCYGCEVFTKEILEEYPGCDGH